MEDELLALRDIHLTPLERPEEPVQAVQEEEEDQGELDRFATSCRL